MKVFLSSLRVGFFLANRDIRRANKWTTGLIVFVMTLTFLNLIVIRGILIGIIQGALTANKQYNSGEIIIIPLSEKTFISNTHDIEEILKNTPGVKSFSSRYTVSAKLETGYRTKFRQSDLTDSIGTILAGFDPLIEDKTTRLAGRVIEGSYLDQDDKDKVLIGSTLLYKYSQLDTPGFTTLKNVEIGSKIRLVVNGIAKEVIIKGVVQTKVNSVDARVFMTDSQVRQFTGRNDFNVNEIAVRVDPKFDTIAVKDVLKNSLISDTARVQTSEEALPQFLLQMMDTFALLGNVIGTIGLIVATITIFIVIFVNAITRRKYIGILKGIGIESLAIEVSYMLQSMFYALAGSGIAILLIYLVLVPYFDAHPISFPFSEGELVVTTYDIISRTLLLLTATIFSGYLPARIVVKQNTLDAILGR